ncbi:hypothetical protein OKA04_14995 [Luteolibacter flavescens]|uniref:Uncharacterized protein n=1 Tax=Luteolibacter flavescens TaxID=1859460 RepID=A0ABT3FR42_9BACT|nr:hypothetical protein [Luteolibacter flavescens]MCW1886043.1 hypothetical protein [Luteolibacter flavescens]
MSSDTKRPSWWGPRSGFLIAIGFGAVAAGPFLLNGAKALAQDGKVDVKAVMNETRNEKEKKDREHGRESREMKSAALLADGTLYAGGKGGLAVRSKDGEWSIVKDFPVDEAKSMAAAADGSVWVSGKRGLYQLKEGAWTTVKEGDFHSVSVGADGTVLVVGKKGLLTRSASGDWNEAPALLPEGVSMPPEKDKEEKKDEHGHDHHDGEKHDH